MACHYYFLLFFTTSTLDEEKEGNFYLEVGGGDQFPQSTTIKAPISGTTYKLDYEFDSSGIYGLGLGYDFGQWRLHGSHLKRNIVPRFFKARWIQISNHY